MPQGQFGKVRAFNDFTSPMGDISWGSGQVDLGGGVGFVSVNEGTVNEITDEGNGKLQFLTDTGDNDNVCLLAGKFRPAEHPVMEARFTVADDTNVAFFVGFTETMAFDTPVMPAEHATATMTYQGSGGMVGLQYDLDSTTSDWRAVMGDGGAAISDSGTTGVRASDAPVADEYQVVRVELHSDGSGSVYLDEEVVKRFDTGTLLTTTDFFYAVLMLENREGAAKELEVDYFFAEAARDWSI